MNFSEEFTILTYLDTVMCCIDLHVIYLIFFVDLFLKLKKLVFYMNVEKRFFYTHMCVCFNVSYVCFMSFNVKSPSWKLAATNVVMHWKTLGRL